jgi:hypothetical protein
MTAVTKALDADALPTGGDLWQLALDPAADFTPVVLQPGGTAKLTLTITASGTPGTAVSGAIRRGLIAPQGRAERPVRLLTRKTSRHNNIVISRFKLVY